MGQLRFDERVVVISGAGRGIGREYALLLAGRGARVVVNDIGGAVTGSAQEDGSDPASDVVAEIERAGGVAVASQHDISLARGAQEVIALALEHFDQVDAVIANAGINSPRIAFTEFTPQILQRMLDVQLFGTWGLIQAAWPHLAAHGRGRVVVTSSQAALYGMPDDPAYSAAKGAILALGRSLALEGEKHGIKVNVIVPSAYTRMVEHTIEDAALRAGLQRVMPARLVAPGAAVLTHDSCPINGEILICGAGHVGRAFVGETSGITLPHDALTPEAIAARFEKVCDEAGYKVPKLMGESGDPAVFAEIAATMQNYGKA